MWSILVLHPRHKLEYFKQAVWEDDWIEIAENLVRDEFQRSYSSIATSRSDDEEDTDVDMESVDQGQSTKVCLCILFPAVAQH